MCDITFLYVQFDISSTTNYDFEYDNLFCKKHSFIKCPRVKINSAASFIPILAICELRVVIRYHIKLDYFFSEANQLQNSLTVSNITLSSVLSKLLGVTGSRIIDAMLDLSSLIYGSFKKQSHFELTIDGKIITKQIEKIIIKSHYDVLTFYKENFKTVIIEIASKFKLQQELIQKVYGCFKSFVT